MYIKLTIKIFKFGGSSLMAWWLGFRAFIAMAQGSILGWRPEFPQAQQLGKKKKKKKSSLVRIKLLLIKILSMSPFKKIISTIFFSHSEISSNLWCKNRHIH